VGLMRLAGLDTFILCHPPPSDALCALLTPKQEHFIMTQTMTY